MPLRIECEVSVAAFSDRPQPGFLSEDAKQFARDGMK